MASFADTEALTQQQALPPAAEPLPAAAALPSPFAMLDAGSVIALQRSAGNSAVAGMLARRAAAVASPARRLARDADDEDDVDESELGVVFQDDLDPAASDETVILAEQQQDAATELQKAEDHDAAAANPLPDAPAPDEGPEPEKEPDATVLETDEAQEPAPPPEAVEEEGAGEEPGAPGATAPAPAPAPGPTPPAGAGRPLSAGVRTEMEQALSVDLGHVRLHNDPAAQTAAYRLGASAFTTGSDVSFGREVADPEASAHRGLLRHELEHVAENARGQQGADGVSSEEKARAGIRGSAAPQTAPTVTAVAAGAEIGVGKTMDVTATAAGTGALTWTLTGAPAGVTIAPTGRRTARVRASAASLAGAGGSFTVQAALATNAADNASAPSPTTLVGVSSATFAPNPAFPASIAALIPAGGPANTADPNRDGVAGNTATVNAVTAPAGRPVTIILPTPLGATAAGTTITPGATTGKLKVQVRDNATGATLDTNMFINPVPLALSGFGAQSALGGPYGPLNPLRWRASDAASPLNRIVGETITAGGADDFGIPINAGFNPSPLLNLAVPANSWSDQLFTPAAHPGVDINRFVGPGAPKSLPGLWILRQGFHWLSWNGAAWSSEFDNGTHHRALVKRGAGFAFETTHKFPGATSPIWRDAYAGPPLIVLSGITGAPLAPAAVGIAADGVATANVNVASSVAGRSVNWTMVNGSAAFTAGFTAAPVGTPATLTAGLVPSKVKVRATDTASANRQVEGNISLLAVRLGGISVPVKKVPSGTLTAVVNLDAQPGGRTLNAPVLDGAATAGGVTAAVTAPGGANAAARTITITRPAAFTGTVTVTVSDSVLPAQSAAAKVQFK